ncbi:MAG: protoglobin family protein [Verrucomicrobia bacterium]|nr:protoglobin family protein [Verrucomicrobiota bacterium]
MKKIDETRLETDLGYRFQYLADFMGFGAEDIKIIHAAAPLLAPLVPSLVDAVYAKLIQYDATWRHFMPRQAGFDGPIPASLEQLTMDHPQIAFRKKHLARYLERLVTAPYDDKMVGYLDMVGKMHTDKAGSPDIQVPLVQMNALMGYVADAVNATILGMNIPADLKASAIRAFSKLLWVQNDLINRHYQAAR